LEAGSTIEGAEPRDNYIPVPFGQL
jgi:hypothetical protein